MNVVGTKLEYHQLEDILDRRHLCGVSAMDVPAFIRAIRATGFDGTWGVEILADEHRKRTLATR